MDRRLTTRSCALVGGNPVAWKSTKPVVAQSSSKAKHRAIIHGCCQLLLLKILLKELGFKQCEPMTLHCDNTSTLHIANNPVHHKCTTNKHIEVEYHFIREKVTKQETKLSYTSTRDQMTSFLTKVITKKQMCDVLSNLGVSSACAPARRRVLWGSKDITYEISEKVHDLFLNIIKAKITLISINKDSHPTLLGKTIHLLLSKCSLLP